MGTITTRTRKNGTATYLAQIVIKAGGVIQRRENKTFTDLRDAKAWIAVREADRNAPVADPLLGAVIEKYVDESLRKIGRTKAQVLRAIKRQPIARMHCSKITSRDVVTLATTLAQDRTPQTVANYISHLGAVFAIARPAWGYPLDPQAALDAMRVAKRLGLTSRSRSRDRRPTFDELQRLVAHFAKKRSGIPMVDVIAFAVFSTRRQEEITRLRWADLDAEHGRVLVRDMKHPGEKIGNDQWVDLPPQALAIALRQPRTADVIFPWQAESISTAFTLACKLLGIDDLRFHDLRHDGISRLFELGWNIPHVAAVSGHRSWQSLKRYTHIRQRGDKYEKNPGW